MWMSGLHDLPSEGEDTMKPKRQTISATSAAEYLGLSRAYIYRLIEKGDLPYWKAGERQGIRLYLDGVQAFQEKREGE